MSQLNVDNIQNRTGSSGGPNFPSGISVAVGQTAYIHGNLQVDGTETIINTETLNVADKTVGIGSTSNASNTTADGSGIEVFASSSQTGNNKTLTWGNTANSWEFGPNDVGLKVGVGVTIYGETGIVSATSFKGDGSELTGIDATAIQTGNTSVQTVDTGSDGHVKMTTEGGERVRVGPAGQIGLGGANYGTSGQVITSAGSGSAPSWSAIPPAGNQFTAIANGSIAAGKPAIIESDGKVAEVKFAIANTPNPDNIGTNLFYINDGNSSTTNIQANRGSTAVYDPVKDKVIVFWKQSGGSPLYCRVGAPNRTTGALTWGNRVMIDNGQCNNPTAIYDTVRDKVVVMGFVSNSLRAWVGTTASSGNSITWTSDYTCNNTDANDGSNTSSAFDPTTGRTIIVYTDQSNGSSNYWCSRMQIGHVDGSGAFVWHTGITSPYNNSISRDMFSNALGKIETHDVISVGSSKWLYVCSIESDAPGGFQNKALYGKIVNAPTSTTAVPTYANAGAKHIETYSSTQRGVWPNLSWDPTKEKFIVAYRTESGDSAGGGKHHGMLCYFNTGKTDITINNTSYSLSTSGNSQASVTFDPDTGRFVFQVKGNSQVDGKFLTCSGTGNNTLTVSSGSQLANFNPTDFGERNKKDFFSIGRGGGNISALFSYYTNQSTSQCNTVISGTEASTPNANCSNIIGFSAAAYTNGQTATIKTVGNVIDNQSGLTPGTQYFIQGDGTLGTSWDSTTFASCASNQNFAGTAIAADKLLIRDINAKY